MLKMSRNLCYLRCRKMCNFSILFRNYYWQEIKRTKCWKFRNCAHTLYSKAARMKRLAPSIGCNINLMLIAKAGEWNISKIVTFCRYKCWIIMIVIMIKIILLRDHILYQYLISVPLQLQRRIRPTIYQWWRHGQVRGCHGYRRTTAASRSITSSGKSSSLDMVFPSKSLKSFPMPIGP